MAAAVVLRKVPFGVLLFKRLVFRRELRLPDREEEHGDGDEHNGRHNDKQRLIVHMIQTGGLGVGVEHRRNAEIQNAADCAHQINDGVRARTQGLWRHVWHEGDGGSAVRSHGDEQQAENNDERSRLEAGRLGGVAVVEQRENVHKDDGAASAEEDKGHPLADFCMALIRDGAEERQQKERQNVVRRHDCAGECFVHVEGLREDQRHDAVVHLPERADGQEREADQDGTFAVEFHFGSPFSSVLRTSRIFCIQYVG